MVPSPYRRILSIKALRTPLVGATIGRLPIAGVSLATILLVHAETGSFAIAGLVEAAFAIAGAVARPIQGRLIDRLGQTSVLSAAAILNPLSLIALVLAAQGGAAPAILAAIGAACGATMPALGPSMRTLWAALVGDTSLRQSAFAFDAALLEVAFVVGPLGTAALVSLGSPSTAVVVNAGFATVGTLIFAASRASREWRGEPSGLGWAGALTSPGILALVVVELALGAAIGGMEISTTALATGFGSPAFAGVLISVQGAASMVGGLWYGSRHHSANAADRYAPLVLILALCFVPLLLTSSKLDAVPLLALSGFAFAPTGAVLWALIDDVAPPGTVTEAATWMNSAIVTGIAAGNAVGGALVAGGHAHRGYAAAIVAVAIAAAVAYRARPVLRPVALSA
jgi:predicted MFS family arabinose efflux permease